MLVRVMSSAVPVFLFLYAQTVQLYYLTTRASQIDLCCIGEAWSVIEADILVIYCLLAFWFKSIVFEVEFKKNCVQHKRF
jgi:hypothetical protein